MLKVNPLNCWWGSQKTESKIIGIQFLHETIARNYKILEALYEWEYETGSTQILLIDNSISYGPPHASHCTITFRK